MIQWRVMSSPMLRRTRSASSAVGEVALGASISLRVEVRIAQVRRPRPIGHSTSSCFPPPRETIRMSLAPVRKVMPFGVGSTFG
ncbi:hypothetical protein HQ535_02185, partial [bacterium]|nr:hypothetical protein [bacterium]